MLTHAITNEKIIEPLLFELSQPGHNPGRLPEVDVGQICSSFGGGGHSFAASASIKDKAMAEIKAELLAVLVSFISPFRAERQMARERLGDGEFVEIFVDTPFEECARRDPKGLYAKALRGELRNFTGVDSPYEVPLSPELHLETAGRTAEALADTVAAFLAERGYC